MTQDRREFLKRLAKGAAYAIPVITTLAVPDRAGAFQGMGMGMGMQGGASVMNMGMGGQGPPPPLPPGPPPAMPPVPPPWQMGMN